jgi:hypothetical protein
MRLSEKIGYDGFVFLLGVLLSADGVVEKYERMPALGANERRAVVFRKALEREEAADMLAVGMAKGLFEWKRLLIAADS